MFLGNLLNLVKACSLFKQSFDVTLGLYYHLV